MRISYNDKMQVLKLNYKNLVECGWDIHRGVHGDVIRNIVAGIRTLDKVQRGREGEFKVAEKHGVLNPNSYSLAIQFFCLFYMVPRL